MFCQVMPLFGDMKMKPFDTYVKNSVHFNANKWPLSNSSTTSNQVEITFDYIRTKLKPLLTSPKQS